MINLFRIAAGLDSAATLAATGERFAPQYRATAGAEARENAAAFEALVDAHYRRTFSLIYRMVRNESDAADLTQEAFVRAYRALPRLRETGAQTAWLRRIATNLCLDHLRRRNATPPVSSLDARASDESDTLLSWDIADPTSEPDRLYSARERLAMVHRAIDSLPPDYRLVVTMHHLEDLRVEEIADALGVPSGTIKSRLSRARRELHRKLSPYFDPDMALPGR